MQSSHFILEEDLTSTNTGSGTLISRHSMDVILLSPEERSEEITIHKYCWAILQRVFKKATYNQAWIEEFKERLHFLSGLTKSAPFPVEADHLDADIFSALRPELYGSAHSCRRMIIPLPVELVQRIYDLLTTEEDVVNTCDVFHIGPSRELWRRLGQKYLLAGDLDASVNVSMLVRNLQTLPSTRYPRTTNYRVIWDNCELLKNKMEDTPIITPLSGGGGGTRSRPRSRSLVSLPRDIHVSFLFTEDLIPNLGVTLGVLCGIVLNGRLIGAEGDWEESSVIESLIGFGIVSVGNPARCVGVRILDGSAQRRFGGYLGNTTSSSHCLEFKWNEGCQLIVEHDVGLTFYYWSYLLMRVIWDSS